MRAVIAFLMVVVLLVPVLPAGAGAADTATLTFRLVLDGDVPPGETFVATHGDDQGGGGELPLCGMGAGRACMGLGAVYTASVTLPLGTRFGAGFMRQSDRIRDGGGEIGCCIQPFGSLVGGPGDDVLLEDRTLAASYDFGRPGGRPVGLTFRLTTDDDLPAGQLLQLVLGEVERSRGVPRAQAIVCAPFTTPCTPGATYTVNIASDYGYVEGQTIRHAFRRYAGGQVYEGGPPEEVFGEGSITLAGETAVAITQSFERRCFTETGQCVEGRFLRYWEANGGLARNGFPLSGLRYDQLEDGRFYQVQYFERVRMEYHPENQPPHDVLLGQFGRRIHGGADPPLPPPSGPIPADRVYVEQTGHYIIGAFFNYFYANGGVLQFGFPITEEFEERLEDGKVYRVQYFERARFEHHPENLPPYDILLGQFGRRILAEVEGR